MSLNRRRWDGETALTCASLRLLQLQKLLQEAAVIGKLVGSGRVECVCNSRPKTEYREGELLIEGLGHALPVSAPHPPKFLPGETQNQPPDVSWGLLSAESYLQRCKVRTILF